MYMNSLYKSYIFITLIALVICTGSLVSKVNSVLRDVDRINAYVLQNGSTYGLELKNMPVTYYEETEQSAMAVPDFSYAGYVCSRIYVDDLWLVTLAIVTAFLYIYERSSRTADFCAVLPIKQRGRFGVKLGCLLAISVALLLINVWSVNAFNARLDACNETCKILELERVYSLDLDKVYLASSFAERALLIGAFLFLAECTTKPYLPACILVLGLFALVGAVRGLDSYLNNMFNAHIPTPYFLRVLKYPVDGRYNSSYLLPAVKGVMAVLLYIWGLFLSAKGDTARKNSVFRFKWAENTALTAVVVCAVFCSYELVCLTEINYVLNLFSSTLVMVLSGIVAYIVSRSLIIRLGR